MIQQLTIPQQRDPIARLALFALVGAALWVAAATPSAPTLAQAEQPPIVAIQKEIVIATPTLGLPEPTAPAPMVPGLAGAQPTPQPPIARVEPTQEPAPVVEAPAADAADYVANVGEQAPHSPRGDNRGEIIIVPTAAPEPSEVDPNAQAVPIPTLAPEQAAVIAQRQSNGCAPGQVFVPRSGCHTPGSGGAQPGPVGQP